MDRYMRKFFKDFDSLFNNDFDKMFNQSFGMIGETKTETGKDSKGDWVKQTFTSLDGSIKMTTIYRTTDSNPKSDMVSSKISDLKAEMESCVEKQEFEKAAKLRDRIKNLETNNEKISSLSKELETAVKQQNFEKAIEIRDELKKLQK